VANDALRARLVSNAVRFKRLEIFICLSPSF